MQIGMVGLGRMGGNMVRRLMKGGHACVVYDRGADGRRRLREGGATPAKSPRRAGGKAREAARGVGDGAGGQHHREHRHESPAARRGGDTIIDGGNSFFKDDVRRAKAAAPKGIDYVDAGTSGGVWGPSAATA